jgi:hypothetical protein
MLVLGPGAVSSAHATIYHVDAGAPGPTRDGLSWDTAFTRLEDALQAAIFFDEIRVAQGTYVPDATGLGNPRDASFEIPAAAFLLGGFAGHAGQDPNERDVARFVTILSGDLNGDDFTGGDNSENCSNVLTANLVGIETLLSGFTITGGRSDALFAPPFFPFGKPGGGLWTVGSITVEDCRFVGNQSMAGGGMVSFEGSPVLRRCIFENNIAVDGGALTLFGTDDPLPPNVAGGGSVAHGTPMLTDCVFNNNHASDRAGGVWVDGIAENPRFERCRFSGNTAGADGGGLWTGGGFCDLINCLFDHNAAEDEGGAIYNDTLVTIQHSTITENHAGTGGGIFSPFVRAGLTDSILWGNTADDAVGENAQAGWGFLAPIANFTCVEGWSGDWGGDFNIGDDPQFVPGPAGCYYLSHVATGQSQDSACVDAGSSLVFVSFIAGLPTRRDEVEDLDLIDLGFHYPVTDRPFVAGDGDFNQLVNLADFAGLQRCFQSAGEGSLAPCCRTFDFVEDGDVLLEDYALFLVEMTP